ncbi:Na/Pi cotransporter family protein [Ectothiorhodospiraceae bacterium 2226]|nr:Na/Pi cotransporter family protein [Ectothiorhodospiraceae bacterium 2226]
MSIWGLVQFAGGLGLFLLGMKLMTGGLQVAAGPALRTILARSTSRPLRGLATGALFTALVQSSSAVIFATIGFVNAGLMSLLQAVGVIYGANVGTTVTSWIVASAGVRLDLQLLAMPAIALGMLLRVAGGQPRTGALGEAIAGLGVFLLGIEVLKNAFGATEIPLEGWTAAGPLQLLAFVAAGFLITLSTQSSSATLAITLTAAAGGLISTPAAAAVIIGADLGTTSTAAFAAIGATSNARRAASAHVLFNVVGGTLALLLLPLLLGLADALAQGLGAGAGSVISLAVFHTLIKLLGVSVMWPLTPRLVTFLEQRFRAAEEDEARPRYLDHTLTETPALAMEALGQELRRVGDLARRITLATLRAERSGDESTGRDMRALEELVTAVGDFTLGVRSANLPTRLQEALPLALRISRYHLNAARAALDALGARQQAGGAPLPPELRRALAEWRDQAVQLVEACARLEREPDAGLDEHPVLEQYQQLKAAVLREGAGGRVHLRLMVAQLDELSAIRRLLDQSVKAARQLVAFERELRADAPDEAVSKRAEQK